MSDVSSGPDPDKITSGWYPDPSGRFESRFHNGDRWTADVANDGQRYIDPLGTQSSAGPYPIGQGSAAQLEPNPAATASMVLGIIAVTTAWMPFIVVIGAISAIVALVVGAIGWRRSSSTGTGRAFALTGLITGAVALAVAVVGVLLSVVVLSALDRYENPSPNDALVTVCEKVGDSATMVGEITNLGGTTASFSVEVAFVRPGTDNVQRSARIAVDDVEPGAIATFRITRGVALSEVECIVRGVDGPLPFGLAIG